MPERHVRDVIGEFFRRGGMLRSVRRAEAVVAWPRIVGAELARFAQARALRSGVLLVDVSDSETAMHLSLQRARFLDAYERYLGRREVRDIRFAAGRRAPPPAASPPQPPRDPDPQAWSALAAELGALDLPAELAGPALAAARAMLTHRRRAREAGWTPCPHCGALSPDPGPCDACRRYRADPGVRFAAERLVTDPDAATPELSDDERVVARALAVEALDARLLELLPQVLAAPELKPQLAQAARHRVALDQGRPTCDIDDADLDRLDPRIARVLGRWGSADPRGGTTS